MYDIHSEILSEIYKIRSAESLKLVRDMTITYSEIHHEDKYLEHSHKPLFLSILNINKLYTQNENEMHSISWPQLHKGLIKC